MNSQVKPTRALIVVRLSRLSEESTSPERQRQECERLCAERGLEVVGVAQDLDVSAGKTSPFQRPALSEWIGDGKKKPGRMGEFDTIVFFRLDRLVRSVKDLWAMIGWSEDHGVTLVSASEKHFDLSDKFGRAIVSLVATVAELELDAISERNANAFQHNLKEGKWRGGIPFWGYVPQQTEDGWRLVQDPETVPLILSVVDRVLEGEPLRAIAHDLTERKVLTPKDRFAQYQGREVSGYRWHSGQLKRSLSSPALLGLAVSRGEVVRGDDGSPVVRSEPILARSVFDRLQTELANRENRAEPNKRTTALLLGVIYCGVCGRRCYRLKGGKNRTTRYRCSSAQDRDSCGNRSIPLPTADDAVTRTMLNLLGDSERLERVWDAGVDYSAELAEVHETMDDLTDQIGTPAFKKGTPQRARLDKRMNALAARRDELTKLTSRAAGWTWEPTGETFADWWNRQTVQEQNVYLQSMGVSLGFTYPLDPDKKNPRIRLDLGDLGTLLGNLKPVGAAKGYEDLFSKMEPGTGLIVRADDVTMERSQPSY